MLYFKADGCWKLWNIHYTQLSWYEGRDFCQGWAHVRSIILFGKKNTARGESLNNWSHPLFVSRIRMVETLFKQIINNNCLKPTCFIVLGMSAIKVALYSSEPNRIENISLSDLIEASPSSSYANWLLIHMQNMRFSNIKTCFEASMLMLCGSNWNTHSA